LLQGAGQVSALRVMGHRGAVGSGIQSGTR
jgi:hypothetical protein